MSPKEINHNNYLAPLDNHQWEQKRQDHQQPQQQQQHQDHWEQNMNHQHQDQPEQPPVVGSAHTPASPSAPSDHDSAPLDNHQWEKKMQSDQQSRQQEQWEQNMKNDQRNQPEQQAVGSTATPESASPASSDLDPAPVKGIFLTAVSDQQPQQLRRLEQHQQHLRQLQQRQEEKQEKQRRRRGLAREQQEQWEQELSQEQERQRRQWQEWQAQEKQQEQEHQKRQWQQWQEQERLREEEQQQEQQQEQQRRQWMEQQQQQQQRTQQEKEELHRQWMAEERERLEHQRQLERQRRELLQLQLQQQQHEHRQRRQMLQWQLQLELEQQHQQQRQKQQQQQQQQHQQQQLAHKGRSDILISPSSGLCTIYEAMETSEEEDEGVDEEGGSFDADDAGSSDSASPRMHGSPRDLPLRMANGNLRHPPQDLDWSRKVDMVQKLINQTLLLSSGETCPPLLLLPGQGGGTLSPLESSLWPDLLPPLGSPSAMITSVSSFSPDSQGSSPQGDWTVVEVETHH
ncbi:bromodomain-containing protein DDB_G0280777-like [Engraulis encrasicolus]|uniref:bromodomain-containing protein DDB_G0280777-like n=1 Tax=Engraulis encrasicolus TaxID=184585 RepID=UPI002FD69685